MSKVDIVIGSQWGDEGKGKLVDKLAETSHLVCRCQGGNNAGHTVIVDGVSFFFHLVPSGVINKQSIGMIGNGVVVHLPSLFQEIDTNVEKGLSSLESRLKISNRCHIVSDIHQAIDQMEEELRGANSIGTTKRGIGPAYASKVNRNGLRMSDLMGDWDHFVALYNRLYDYALRRYPTLQIDKDAELQNFAKYRERLRTMVCDTVSAIHAQLEEPNKNILIEGAQSCLLDIDFGTYPFVTSSNCSVGGVCTGLGIPPSLVGNVYGVVKAYTSRVGCGPFPTEVPEELAAVLRTRGKEFGVTTGRPRRMGWLDTVGVRYAAMISGFRALALTKLDILDDLDEIKLAEAYVDRDGKEVTQFPASLADLSSYTVKYRTLPGWKCPVVQCRRFDDLPEPAKEYIRHIEQLVEVPVRWIGVGPARDELITRF